MSRWVDAEWLMKYFKRGKEYKGEYVLDDLKYDAPSIDIVRCGECKYCNSNDGYASMNPQWAGRCTLIKMYPFRNWFCASGERKTEQTETPTSVTETPIFDAGTPTNRPSLHKISQLVVNDCINCETERSE